MPPIPEPTSTDTISVEVTLEATGAWEVWDVTVPADATDEWILANFGSIEDKQFAESGNTSFIATQVERP